MIEYLDPVLLSRIQFAFTLSFHIFFPGLNNWSGELAGRARMAMAENRQHGLCSHIPHVGQDCRHVRHGRRIGRGHVIPVRDELVRILGQSREHLRAIPGLRGAERILSGGLISWGHVVWLEPGQPPDAFCCNSDCGAGDPDFRILDPVCQ